MLPTLNAKSLACLIRVDCNLPKGPLSVRFRQEYMLCGMQDSLPVDTLTQLWQHTV